MNLKFYKLLENLLNHIATKFYGHWIYTLGIMDFIFRSTESARNVTNNRIYQESLLLKGPQVGNMFTSG